MTDNKVTVVARILAKPGMGDVVKEALMKLVPLTRKEAGCLNYDLHRSADDPDLFMFYENWSSRKDLNEHLEMPYLKEFLGRAGEILAKPVEIIFWDMISDLGKS
jgi:quinol monooxygenase YgiN